MTLSVAEQFAPTIRPPQVCFIHPRRDALLIDGEHELFYVDSNLRCPDCSHPLTAVAALTPSFREDDAVVAILDGLRRLSAYGCGVAGVSRLS